MLPLSGHDDVAFLNDVANKKKKIRHNASLKIETMDKLKNITDKKRNAPLRFSPLRSPFITKILIIIKYSFLIKSYQKLQCDLDEYMYFPCVGTKHIKANGKRVLEALIQRYCLHEIQSMFYICKV